MQFQKLALGSFWALKSHHILFYGFHEVPIRELLLGKKQEQQQEQQQQQEEKVAKITSFSMGFRSYIREFLGAILILFRPSLPWCFPIRELLFE